MPERARTCVCNCSQSRTPESSCKHESANTRTRVRCLPAVFSVRLVIFRVCCCCFASSAYHCTHTHTHILAFMYMLCTCSCVCVTTDCAQLCYLFFFVFLLFFSRSNTELKQLFSMNMTWSLIIHMLYVLCYGTN